MKVSVIIRTANRENYLKDCLKSLYVQTYKNFEVIIVNDGHCLKNLLETSEYLPENIKYIKTPRINNRSSSANTGLKNTTGDLVCFLDDDDIFYSHHIQTLVNEFKNDKNKNVIYSDSLKATQIVCPWDKKQYKTIDQELSHSQDFDFKKLLQENFLPILSVMFKRSAVGTIAFDENLDVIEDWDFWVELAKLHKFYHLKEITSEYRIRKDGTNSQGNLDYIWWYSREYFNHKHQDLLNEYNLKKIKVK